MSDNEKTKLQSAAELWAKSFYMRGKIAAIAQQHFIAGAESDTAKEYWLEKFKQEYKQVFDIADVPQIIRDNPAFISTNPSEANIAWANEKIKRWRNLNHNST